MVGKAIPDLGLLQSEGTMQPCTHSNGGQMAALHHLEPGDSHQCNDGEAAKGIDHRKLWRWLKKHVIPRRKQKKAKKWGSRRLIDSKKSYGPCSDPRFQSIFRSMTLTGSR